MKKMDTPIFFQQDTDMRHIDARNRGGECNDVSIFDLTFDAFELICRNVIEFLSGEFFLQLL